jgi:hypothetical protein
MDKTNKKLTTRQLTIILVVIGIITIVCIVIFELDLFQFKLNICLNRVDRNTRVYLSQESMKVFDEHFANRYRIGFSNEEEQALREGYYKVYDYYQTKRVECFDKYGL